MLVPKLSIITINYNNLAGLEKTIKSVINQTYKNFEYVIIDGGSTDGSKELIEKNKEHLTYWVSEPDKGVYNAMNKGWGKASGEYCLFLNSGDWFFDDQVVDKFISYNTTEDIVYGNSMFINEKQETSLQIFPDVLSFYYFFTDTLNHQCIFKKRSTIEAMNGFDESYKILADWKMYTLAICLHKSNYRRIPLTVCFYDTTGMSFSPENRVQFSSERNRLYREDFSAFYSDYLYIDQLRKLSYSRIIKGLKKIGLFKFFTFKTPR